ncbi:hypothetical protein D9M72_538450 [compost metagenome]
MQFAQPGSDLGGHHAAEAVAVEVQAGQLFGADVFNDRDHNLVNVQPLVGIADGGKLAALAQGSAQGVEDPLCFLPAGFITWKQDPA